METENEKIGVNEGSWFMRPEFIKQAARESKGWLLIVEIIIFIVMWKLFYGGEYAGFIVLHTLLTGLGLSGSMLPDWADIVLNNLLYGAGVLVILFYCRFVEFSEKVMELNQLRFRLFSIWWKANRREVLGDDSKVRWTAEDYRKALSYHPDRDCLMKCLIRKYQEVKALHKTMPKSGDEKACREYGRNHGVEVGNVLKEIPAPRYWRQKNPSLIISGVQPASEIQQKDNPTIRVEEELIIAAESCSEPGNPAGYPEGVVLLYREMETIRAQRSRVLTECQKWPGYSMEDWAQPWRPLFVEWKVRHNSLPIEAGNSCWQFNGNDYCTGLTEEAKKGRLYGGISILDENSRQLLFHEMDIIVKESGNTQLKEQLKAADIQNWKLIGQELTGLTEQLAQLDNRAFRRPVGEKIENCNLCLDQVLGFWDEDEDFLQETGGSIACTPWMGRTCLNSG